MEFAEQLDAVLDADPQRLEPEIARLSDELARRRKRVAGLRKQTADEESMCDRVASRLRRVRVLAGTETGRRASAPAVTQDLDRPAPTSVEADGRNGKRRAHAKPVPHDLYEHEFVRNLFTGREDPQGRKRLVIDILAHDARATWHIERVTFRMRAYGVEVPARDIERLLYRMAANRQGLVHVDKGRYQLDRRLKALVAQAARLARENRPIPDPE